MTTPIRYTQTQRDKPRDNNRSAPARNHKKNKGSIIIITLHIPHRTRVRSDLQHPQNTNFTTVSNPTRPRTHQRTHSLTPTTTTTSASQHVRLIRFIQLHARHGDPMQEQHIPLVLAHRRQLRLPQLATARLADFARRPPAHLVLHL